MIYSIDRFEGEYAICENDMRQSIQILRSKLPVNAVEGSCINVIDENNIVLDQAETDSRKQRILDLQNRLFKK